MRALFVLGRAIFGGFFIYHGITHYLRTESMAQYAASKGVPAPDAAVRATGAMLLAGGASIVAGLNARQGLATIVAFLIPTTLQMHRFWEETDPQRRMAEAAHFAKNMALVGAALALMQIEEPWPVSVDRARENREDMYVRLGGRDLPALPA